MAKDRLTPCISYICQGQCENDREADHNGYCQKCDKYKPRAKIRHRNRKKDKIQKELNSERY